MSSGENSPLMDSPEWMRRIASANSGATEITVSRSTFALAGTVFVATTSAMSPQALRRWAALPVNRPCVQATRMLLTSYSLIFSIRVTIEPPVAISSSRTMTSRPSTSPTMASMTTESSAWRRLEPAAMPMPRRRAKWPACLALPKSGETTTALDRSMVARKCDASTGSAERWSTGTEKNPCTCSACSAMVTTRVAPAVAMRSATRRPPMEMRGASFLSERA